MTRKQHRARSNNTVNPNQNRCAYTVASTLGVADNIRYLHMMPDVVRAVRTKHTVRSRMSSVKGLSVGAARKKLTKLSKEVAKCIGFLVQVEGHVLLVGPNGDTTTDTAKRKRDRRKMVSCYIVYGSAMA